MNKTHWDKIYKRWYRGVENSIVPNTAKTHPEELEFQQRRLKWLLKTFSFPHADVVEFGAGSGHIAKYMESLGYEVAANDQSEWAVEICRFVGIPSCVFDMKRPYKNTGLARGRVVVTSCSMEQLGKDWKPFYHMLLDEKPVVVIHQEPLFELYGPGDEKFKQYHLKQNYLTGYLPAIPKEKILHLKHQTMGHRHHAFSELVWKP